MIFSNIVPSKTPWFFCVTLSEPKHIAGAIICPGIVIFTFHFLIAGSIFQIRIHTFFRYATGENQSILEVSWDIDSESRQFQLGRGTYPRLYQSTLYLSAILKGIKTTSWFKSYSHFTEGGFCLLVELHREGFAPAPCAAGLFLIEYPSHTLND